MTDVKLNGMRELSFKEVEDVSGGIVWTPWLIGAAISAAGAGGFAVGSFFGWTTTE